MRRDMSFLDMSLAIGRHVENMPIKKIGTGWNLVLTVEMMTPASAEHKSIKI